MSAPGAPTTRESRLGAVGLIALLVASVALGLYVYKARTPDLALEVTSMPREFRDDTAAIEFFVRFDEPDATIEIVGRDLVVVKTLGADRALQDGQVVRCVWDGSADGGGTVEPGRYRLRVTLPSEDRVMVFPRRIDVKRTSPLEDDEDEDALVAEPCEDVG